LPVTLVGLCFAVPFRLSGGKISWHPDGQSQVWEASGGSAPWLLNRLSLFQPVDAITFGHIILARDAAVATSLRAHEHEHIRQYQRCGIFFPVAYFVAGVVARLRGKDAYWDNLFEIDARAADAKIKSKH